MTLTIIVPVFNEELAMPIFFEEFKKASTALPKVAMTVLFVNDGSSDTTLEVAKDLSKKDNRIKYISLSRNFGKEAAMLAGLKAAKTDLVAIMDVDGQDPFSMLVEMVEELKNDENLDVVGSRRVSRKGEPPIRSLCAKIFYKMIQKISHTKIVDGARDFRVMRLNVVEAILEMSEVNRFSKGIFAYVGFNTKWLEYENIERSAGETKWSFFKLVRYSLSAIVAFSTAPLVFASFVGILFCIISFVVIVFVVTRALIFGDPTTGWPSMISIVLFVGGIQLFCVGVLGQYLSKTYLESKRRPTYFIREDNLNDK